MEIHTLIIHLQRHFQSPDRDCVTTTPTLAINFFITFGTVALSFYMFFYTYIENFFIPTDYAQESLFQLPSISMAS